MNSPPDNAPRELTTTEELKQKLGRVRQLLQGHESYHRRFAHLQNQIDQLNERLRKLEPQNSPPENP